MEKNKGKRSGIAFKVTYEERSDFDETLHAVVFDSSGNQLDRAEVKSGKVKLDISESALRRARVFITPITDNTNEKKLTLETMYRVGAYQALVSTQGTLIDNIHIPDSIVERWLYGRCYVHGQVIRSSDSRAICGARVHICEVDKLPLWIWRLPEIELNRLRDDFLDVIKNPPVVDPSDPFPTGPFPNQDSVPFDRSVFRFDTSLDEFQPQPEFVSAGKRHLNTNLQDVTRSLPQSTSELVLQLGTSSTEVLRSVLSENWKLIYPWFCVWPWWQFRCDEVAVVTTDDYGRFEANISYPRLGDHPDLYFWVEYDFGSGYETVYHPPIPCHTYWNFSCGSEVTVRVSDARVPGCTDEPDLPGCQVLMKSIGNQVAIQEINSDSAGSALEGLLTTGEPFGATLEPRVDFSRTCLIDTKNVPYYRWSYRRLSGPDGISTAVSEPASEPISTVLNPANAPASDWTILTKEVFRHYRDGTSYPADLMGPMPTSVAPIENLFRIRPVNPPVGAEWKVFNEHVDLATAYFESASLAGTPDSGPITGITPGPAPDDLAAGRYELKFELFDDTGNLVNWTDKGIDLRITDQNAPFGTGTITSSVAPAYNRILDVSGKTIGFKMTVRIDNNHCYAEVLPVAGDVTPDPACGFHNYEPGDDARLRFIARHPNDLATYTFNSFKASGPAIPVAATTGLAGKAGNNGYINTSGFQYEKDITVSVLLTTCSNAAFAERLDVVPWAQNGYTRLNHLRHADTAAFSLAQPCSPCFCDEEEDI